MPRLNYVKKARKDNPVAKKGESYYWWKFRNGGKRYSKERPPRSALTQSAYFGRLWDLQDGWRNDDEQREIEDIVSDIVSVLDEMRDECQESLDNMPDSLQYSPTGELLQERIDSLENGVSELEGIDPIDDDDYEVDRDHFDPGAEGDQEYAETVEAEAERKTNDYESRLSDIDDALANIY